MIFAFYFLLHKLHKTAPSPSAHELKPLLPPYIQRSTPYIRLSLRNVAKLLAKAISLKRDNTLNPKP